MPQIRTPGFFPHDLCITDKPAVQMEDRLTGRETVIDADIESVGRVFPDQPVSRLLHGPPQSGHFILCCLEDRCNMAFRQDKRVAGRNRERVPDREGKRILGYFFSVAREQKG
jgi:hypothetical protein